ncbi:MFS transporter [Polyangium sp. y55x31]|uniref:MFS transporter n=1 Tax=Polyangium sp. y55x31 TaxID=3042688 RepID=UPI00248243D8|nr:MFS transporter [Polyangium sp. y55x31]MDI1480368.1 MFS transporter [Polyangium sp. y55x31]
MVATAPTTTAPTTGAAPDAPWRVFWIASVAAFLVSLDTTMLFSAFDALRHSFGHTTAAELSWVLNAYTVVYAAMLIPAGGLADTHGRKRVFLIGVALFLAASAACGLASSVSLLVAARVAQAVGAALLTPASLSIVIAAFPSERRAIVVSLWGAVGGVAAAVGPSLGSFITDVAGWPWAFYINLPLGALALWRGAAHLDESVPSLSRRRVDGVGMALLMLCVGALALAIVETESPSRTRGELAVIAVTGVAAGAAFIAWSRYSRAPLVDLALFENRTYRHVNAATFVFGAAFSMMFLGFFFYMRGIWGYSLPLAGVAVTPGPLLVVPTAIISGRQAARLGHRRFLVGGSLLYAASSLWFMLVPGPQPNYVLHWLPGLLMSGAAVGLVLPSLSASAVSRLPPARYAVGSAVNQATRQMGSVLGVAITVALLGHAALARADFNRLYGLHIVLALLTGLLCLGVDTRPATRGDVPLTE